jgi:nucleobase:cation symporter-1, NCS1 family
VSLLSWWPYIGSMTRQAPTPRVAVMPSMLGMGLPVPVLSIVGLAGILVLQTSDPAQWMTEVGGNALGAVALLFVIAANFGTATAGIYASTVGLKAVPGLRRVGWNMALALSLVPVIVIGVFLPNWFFDNFGTFLAYIGVFFAPLVGIQIVDYFVLRHQRISLRAVYDRSPSAAYAYWGGVNPAAVIAMAAGVGTYLYLLNPQSYAIHEPFSYIGASLPSALVAAVVHVLLTQLLVRRAGKGGYDDASASSGAGADRKPVQPRS